MFVALQRRWFRALLRQVCLRYFLHERECVGHCGLSSAMALHTVACKASAAYRRFLKHCAITFGTC